MTVPPPAEEFRGVGSVQRATQVLRLFVELEPDAGLSVTEIARRLGVAKSTVSRLMSTMAASGLLMVDARTRRYHVGPMAFRLGNRFAGASIASALQPLVRNLSQRTGHTTQLGTLRDGQVLYLAVVQSTERLRVVASPGEIRYAHTSASGKALLAALPDRQRDQLLDAFVDGDGRLLTPRPGITLDRDELLVELDQVRLNGFAVSQEGTAAGVSALGVSVGTNADFPLALSVTFPASLFPELPVAPLIEELQQTASAIERRLIGITSG